MERALDLFSSATKIREQQPVKSMNCVLNDLKHPLPSRIVQQQKRQIQMVILKTWET